MHARFLYQIDNGNRAKWAGTLIAQWNVQQQKRRTPPN